MTALLLRLTRHSGQEWARRLLFLLACLQVVAPASAAVADAWRLDRRTPYAHAESEGTSGCVVVHGDDCLLCSIATTPQARPAASTSLRLRQQGVVGTPCAAFRPRPHRPLPHASPRAPPATHA